MNYSVSFNASFLLSSSSQSALLSSSILCVSPLPARLISGPLQLAPGTHLLLDETALQPGTVTPAGTRNLSSLKDLLQWQKVSQGVVDQETVERSSLCSWSGMKWMLMCKPATFPCIFFISFQFFPALFVD